MPDPQHNAESSALPDFGPEPSESGHAFWGMDPSGFCTCRDCNPASPTTPAECQHDPRYSRSECGWCGGQEAWCDKCEEPLCGCPIPPATTEADS